MESSPIVPVVGNYLNLPVLILIIGISGAIVRI